MSGEFAMVRVRLVWPPMNMLKVSLRYASADHGARVNLWQWRGCLTVDFTD
jgi:hypothetical protein